MSVIVKLILNLNLILFIFVLECACDAQAACDFEKKQIANFDIRLGPRLEIIKQTSFDGSEILIDNIVIKKGFLFKKFLFNSSSEANYDDNLTIYWPIVFGYERSDFFPEKFVILAVTRASSSAQDEYPENVSLFFNTFTKEGKFLSSCVDTLAPRGLYTPTTKDNKEWQLSVLKDKKFSGKTIGEWIENQSQK